MNVFALTTRGRGPLALARLDDDGAPQAVTPASGQGG